MQIHQKQNIFNNGSLEDNERRAVELFFQPVDLGVAADGKRFTVSLALCGELGTLSFSFLPWQRGKMTRCCFAVGDAPPSKRLSEPRI